MTRIPLVLPLLILTTLGCGAREDEQFLEWRLAQVDQLQEQVQKNSAAAQALVEADAEARREMAQHAREIQAERAAVDRQRDELEGERAAIARERRLAPIVAAAVQMLGLLVLAALPLVVCWLVLRDAPASAASDLEDHLLWELVDPRMPTALPLPGAGAPACLDYETSPQLADRLADGDPSVAGAD